MEHTDEELFRNTYRTYEKRVFWQTVGTTEETTTYFATDKIATIKEGILKLLETEEAKSAQISSVIETMIKWLEALMFLFRDHSYAILEGSDNWKLEYHNSFILILNWTIVIFKLKDACESFPALQHTLGDEFNDICKDILGTPDWRQWICKRRNVVAHGKKTWIELKVAENWALSYIPTSGDPIKVPYLAEFNRLRKLVFLIYLVLAN